MEQPTTDEPSGLVREAREAAADAAPPAKPDTMVLPTALVQDIADYLKDRPWTEVNPLIMRILACNPPPVPVPPPE